VKALSVTPYPILPLSHGGRVRVFRLSAALAAAGAQVDVLYPWSPGLPPRPFRRNGVAYLPQAFAANLLPRLISSDAIPPLVALSWQPYAVAQRRRRTLLAAHDVAEFHFCAYAAWMERARRLTKVVYVAHNVEVDFAAAHPPSFLSRTLLRRLGELERRAVQASDLVVTCTESDAERLRSLYGGSEYAVVPNGFDEELLGFDRAVGRADARGSLGLDPEERVLLFVGGPARHNRDAVAFLERRLLPSLQPGVTLLVAGRCAQPRRAEPAPGRTVRRLGYVEDLRPLFAAADLGVNPVAHGSGSQLKIAEYLAAGLPIVTTPVGMRGYEPFARFLTVVELDEFRGAIESAQHGHERPDVSGLTWTAVGRRLHAAYARLLDGKP
jgi:glycosyltransferase involved in cell wall biosynthesis